VNFRSGARQGQNGLQNRPGHSHYAGPGPCNKEQQKGTAANRTIIKIGGCIKSKELLNSEKWVSFIN